MKSFERNFGEKEIFFIGINNSGYALAQLLVTDDLNQLWYRQLKSSVNRIRIKPDNPIAEDIYLEEIRVTDLEGKNIILVDDAIIQVVHYSMLFNHF